MIIPADFYYSQTQGRISFTTTPTGRFNFRELLQNKPYWVKPTVLAKKRKKLIICAWFLNVWGRVDGKMDVVTELLKQLHIQGFDSFIYLADTDDVVPFYDQPNNAVNIPHAYMGPAFASDIMSCVARNLKFTRDEVLLIDDHRLSDLLNQLQQPGVRQLNVSEFAGLAGSQQTKLVTVMKSVQPPLGLLIQDGFSYEINQAYTTLMQHFPKVARRADIQSLSLWTDEMDAVQTDAGYTLAEVTLRMGDYKTVRALNLGENDDHCATVDIPSILSAMPNLQILELSQCENISSPLQLSENSLPNLIKLDVRRSDLGIEGIAQIIGAAPNITHITMNALSQDPMPTWLFRPNSMSKLTYFNCQESHINIPTLVSVIEAAPNLQELDFGYCKNGEVVAMVKPNSLRQLKSLKMEGTNLTVASLQLFLQATPNLQKLHIWMCKNISGALQLAPNSLPNLTHLFSAMSDLSFASMKSLLNAAPNIQQVILTYCKDIFSSFELEKNKLSRLVGLNLAGCKLTAQFLAHVFSAAQKIEKLDISGCDIESGAFQRIHLHLQNLEEFNCSFTQISLEDLGHIAGAAPKLRKINIHSCKNLQPQGRWQPIPGSFALLEELDRKDDNLSPLNYTLIAIAAPRLNPVIVDYRQCLEMLAEAGAKFKNLHLKKKDSRIDYGTLPIHCFSELQEVTGDGFSMTTELFTAILRSAPKLKSISLKNLTIEGDASLLKGLCFPHLKKIIIRNVNISPRVKKYLCKAASNAQLELDEVATCSLDDRNLSNAMSSNASASSNWNNSPANPTQPSHNPNKYKDYKPNSEPFRFKGKKDSLDQRMVIDKLCQYLTLTHQYLDRLHELQDGICEALSQFYLSIADETMQAFLLSLQQWDGNRSSLTEVISQHCEHLFKYVKSVYFDKTATGQTQFVGEGIDDYLLKTPRAIRLSNPWHTIALKWTGENQWRLYDPTNPTGTITGTLEIMLDEITARLGNLIAVNSTQALACQIINPDRFIAEGGLLALRDAENCRQILDCLPASHVYSAFACQSLFLRNMAGIPAWLSGLQLPSTAELTRTLIKQFCQLEKSSNLRDKFAKSLACLSQAEKDLALNLLQDLIAAPIDSLEIARHSHPVSLSSGSSAQLDYYRQQLQTWKKQTQRILSLPEYLEECIKPTDKKRRLIQFTSTEELTAFRFALQQHARKVQRPLLYLHKPDDIVCASPFIAAQADGQQGVLCEGPGGVNFDFIRNQLTAAIVLVNYENFDYEAFPKHNKLIEPDRYMDGTSIPEDILVIGLINIHATDCYQHADFYSRFNHKEYCPVAREALLATMPPIPSVEKANSVIKKIDFYNSADWKSVLEKQWIPNGMLFQLRADQLSDVNAGVIEVANGPWDDPDFTLFWRDYCQTHAIQLMKTSGYDWHALRKWVVPIANSEQTRVLNPYLATEFCDRFDCDAATEDLVETMGWIQSAKKQQHPLRVHVTRSLSLDIWAMLLTECARQQIQLQVYLAPGSEFPDELGLQASVSKEKMMPPWQPSTSVNDQVIISSDPDTTVAILKRNPSPWVVWDITECEPSQLLYSIEPNYKKDPVPRYAFRHCAGALIQELQNDRHIILQGEFSEELADYLAPLLIERSLNPTRPGHLIIVSQSASYFQYLPYEHHTVTEAEKRALLGVSDQTLSATLEPYLATEPLCILQARRDYLQTHPDEKSSDECWQGLISLSKSHLTVAAFDPSCTLEQANAFSQMRRDQVNQALKHAPWVFITGFSGVAKTTFITEEFAQSNDTLLIGKSQMETWAQQRNTKGRNYLVIDEATLSASEWTQCEGLHHNPPGIVIQKTYYPLGPDDKIIFIGNPVSYGDERKLARLFKRHGNVVEFIPLPTYFIYWKILQPLFAQVGFGHLAAHVCKVFLDLYCYVTQLSQNDVLITPRELEMMALLTINYYRQQESPSLTLLLTIAKHYTYLIAAHLIPQQHRSEFNHLFACDPLPYHIKSTTPNFVLTPSRYAMRQLLDDLLALRQFRRTATCDAIRYGGLGGLILEGSSGVGKSAEIADALKSNGLIENQDFYEIPMSMDLATREQRLLTAFDKGAIVVMEEINSGPTLEQQMNAYLMWKTLENRRPHMPGFLAIGSKNPITYAGRRATSTAFDRRLITTMVDPYSDCEQRMILRQRGATCVVAAELVIAFNEQLTYAKENHLQPEPTLRDVIELIPAKPAAIKQRMHSPTRFFVEHQAQITNTNDAAVDQLVAKVTAVM